MRLAFTVCFSLAIVSYSFAQTSSPCVNFVGKIKNSGSDWISIYFSNDGRWITQGGTSKLRLWDAESGLLFKEYEGREGKNIPIAFSPDGSMVAAGTKHENIQIWDIETGKLLRILKTKYGDINDLTFSPDGKYIASVGSDAHFFSGLFSGLLSWKERSAKIWDVESGELKYFIDVDFLLHREVIFSSLEFSPDGKIIAIAFEEVLGLWRVEDGQLIGYLVDPKEVGRRIPTFERGLIGGMKFSPNGKLLATTSFYYGTVKLWEVPSGKLYLDTGQGAYSIAFSPDNRFIVLGGKDETARVWDIMNKREIKLLEGHKRAVRKVSISADGKLLATSDYRSTYIWTVNDWKVKYKIEKDAGWSEFNPTKNILGGVGGRIKASLFLWRVDSDCLWSMN